MSKKFEFKLQAPGDWQEWLVIEEHSDHVALNIDYCTPGSTVRSRWQDQGCSIEKTQLKEVIAALQQILDAG